MLSTVLLSSTHRPLVEFSNRSSPQIQHNRKIWPSFPGLSGAERQKLLLEFT
ncbi:MAG: hypothetical protein RLZZ436_2489 [Planctomycetota bacterium]|jgi:hypothetical protein